ncbi:3 beta-hydroxysteroid dehydrogenase/Delta 5--_4-isomerase [Thalassocella blandensis]|nr:3 beta-hydroxysteroid dehydrogenase/Delta 5-->4-isomerase [Thalassocella blandensis]
MKIFITGVTGYVGRNVARSLAKHHELVGLTRASKKPLDLASLGVEIIQGDLVADDFTDRLIGCDALIHTAADTDHKNISQYQYSTNVTGTEALLKAAKTAGVKRFIHLSTESVLLDGKALCKATEQTPTPSKPVGQYSSTKLLAENLVLQAQSETFDVIVLRPRFVWGRDDTTAMPQILRAVENRQFAWIDGGDYLSSTIHIDNLCHGIECALTKGQPGHVYFLSDGLDRSFRETLTALIDAHGYPVPEKNVPRALLYFIARIDNVRRKLLPKSQPLPITMQEYATSAVEVTVQIEKAIAELGYTPIMSFQDGVQRIKADASAKTSPIEP